MAVSPVFIFSLPRSGSTLLQRIIVSTGQVASTSEPWMLLPFVYANKKDGLLSRYWHNYAVKGFGEFVAGLPGGEDDYRAELRHFVLSLYEKRSQDKKYFLDKTPRYHLICEDIYKIFPEAKIIVLWRNPLAVVASILSSWCKNRWKISLFKVDTIDGLSGLLSFCKNNGDNIHKIKYEDLALNPEAVIQGICSYLEIEYDSRCLEDFGKVKLDGSLGDKTGVKKYQVLSPDSIDSWVHGFDNHLRLRWASRYLKSLGAENLKTMGYDYDDLERKVASSAAALPLRSYLSVLKDICFIVKVQWDLFVRSKKGKHQYM